MLPNHYNFREAEPRLAHFWSEQKTYAFNPAGDGPIYTIDTPPPTVSGELHIGHCFSYTQSDVLARFQRMRGARVLYPMGFDDNGLPTERFVEKKLKRKATEMDRRDFIQACLPIVEETEMRFADLWRRLSLSVDWAYQYSTLAPEAQRTSQWSFIQLYQAGKAYTQLSPTLWCPECQTAIAQAEVEDKLLPTLFSTFSFQLEDGQLLPIATTRPELLAACVAIFVHPADPRYMSVIGQRASLNCPPLARIEIPILADELVDPAKGSGAVMCCTFGDSTDVRWWRTHQLPLLAVIGRDGRMTELAGPYAGLSIRAAREGTLQALVQNGLLQQQESIEHSVGTHERCGTPIEYLHTRQWFIRVLDQKERLLEAGRQIQWQPEYMRTRYEHWVENLQWDWCISRQRFLGVPFPAWHCRSCGQLLLAEFEQLPIDPRVSRPAQPCICGGTDFEAEPDVMDTWATSSCTPLIISRWATDPDWFAQHYPLDLRPLAHDIIRTWAFYTIVKSLYHTNTIPWRTLQISGHALSSERGKISKSKAHHELGPLELIEQESADALRYWATSVKPGQDTPLNLETMATGRRLVTKLWNAARFAEGRLHGFLPHPQPLALLPTDRWLLSRLQRTISAATTQLEEGDYAGARSESERFFWSDLCDNYLELAKSRLYSDEGPERTAAQWTLSQALLSCLKLFAPYLPVVTEELYQSLFRPQETAASIHLTAWPLVHSEWIDAQAEEDGELILDVLRQVRRSKAEQGLSVGAEFSCLQLTLSQARHAVLQECWRDLRSATRAQDMRLLANERADLAIAVLR